MTWRVWEVSPLLPAQRSPQPASLITEGVKCSLSGQDLNKPSELLA